jgi:hypothetical protein
LILSETTMKLAACASLMMLGLFPAMAADPVAMKAEAWTVRGDGEFADYKGFAALKLKQTSAQAVPNGILIANGSIEFDVETQGAMGVGIGFRRIDGENYEDFYFRPKPNCATAIDCMQYAPMVHGVLLWDFFPQYQRPAPLADGAWNHIKLTVAGERLSISVNGTLALADARLEGGTTSGGLVLHGPGVFANLTVTPDTAAPPPPAAARSDALFVRHWQVSQPSVLAAGREPALSDMPTAPWQPLAAESDGLVNLTRLYGKPVSAPDRALAWLKTTITARQAGPKTVNIALCREVWVFVNGERVFADKNPYQPPSARKAPDGRCTPQNASFELPLKAGANQIAVAVANNFYGWGTALKLADDKGLRVAKP